MNKRLRGLSRRKGEGRVIPPPFVEVSFSSLDQNPPIWRISKNTLRDDFGEFWRVLI
jgi:hypothetical protein